MLYMNCLFQLSLIPSPDIPLEPCMRTILFFLGEYFRSPCAPSQAP